MATTSDAGEAKSKNDTGGNRTASSADSAMVDTKIGDDGAEGKILQYEVYYKTLPNNSTNKGGAFSYDMVRML